MRETTLPPELNYLAGKVQHVQRVGRGEWSGNCPRCGGSVHRNGELPDRFRMFTEAKGKNKVIGWCRHCGHIEFPDTQKPIDKDEFERWRKEQLAYEEERKRSAEKAIALLKSQKIWENYHAALTPGTLEILKSWGIREDWVRYWKLGLVPDYVVHGKTGEYHTPAISIPLWQADAKVPANIKLRMLNPHDSGDRYRSVYKMGQDFSFTAFPGMKSDTCLLVEGEKKAMVCAEHSNQKFQVVGVPSKTPSPEVLRQLDRYGNVMVCLDPDAYVIEKDTSPMRRMVDILGKERVTYIRLPDKIDDMIVKYGMSLHDALRYRKEVQ